MLTVKSPPVITFEHVSPPPFTMMLDTTVRKPRLLFSSSKHPTGGSDGDALRLILRDLMSLAWFFPGKRQEIAMETMVCSH